MHIAGVKPKVGRSPTDITNDLQSIEKFHIS